MDTLELEGRRDAQFEEEKEIDPLEVEDDIQVKKQKQQSEFCIKQPKISLHFKVWHERAADDQTVLTEEKALNDMPHKIEL